MGNCCASELEGSTEVISGETSQPKIELPPGWKAVPSRSRPGKISYQNIHTGEKIAWVPKEEAPLKKNMIKKKKQAKPVNGTAAGSLNTIKKDDEANTVGNKN